MHASCPTESCKVSYGHIAQCLVSLLLRNLPTEHALQRPCIMRSKPGRQLQSLSSLPHGRLVSYEFSTRPMCLSPPSWATFEHRTAGTARVCKRKTALPGSSCTLHWSKMAVSCTASSFDNRRQYLRGRGSTYSLRRCPCAAEQGR
jgi:hypothetical protein